MKNLIKSVFLLSIFSLSIQNIYSQNLPYTPPVVTINANFNGNLAALDFYGTFYSEQNQGNYGAVWGRGASLNFKFGIGKNKSFRILAGFEYNKMINANDDSFPFFTIDPKSPATDYDIFTGVLGGEYVTKPRCPERFYIGGGFTTNRISAPVSNKNGPIDPAYRFGMQIHGGYEYVFGQKGTFGINIGLKFNYLNLFNSGSDLSPGNTNLNDGVGLFGFKRKIAVTSLNLGVVFNLGQKPIPTKKR